jgi:rubrerythrin
MGTDMKRMTPEECLESAAWMENQAQNVYSALAIRYGERSDLRELFSGLAKEEEQHADRVRALALHRAKRDLSDATMARIAGTLKAVEAELAKLMAVGADGRRPDEPEEILRKVTDFEKRFESIHAEYLAQDFAPGMQGMFFSLARSDRKHAELLKQARDAHRGGGEA